MNKADARVIVYRMTAESLRKMSKKRTEWKKIRGWPQTMTPAGYDKVEREFVELAEKLESKIKEPEPIVVTDFKEEADDPK